MRADCVTLWIGDSLGRVERACLRSIARHHRVAVYCYGETRGVPDEVEVRDANQVIPANEIFFQRNGSVAAFSDRFRYELLRANAGTWVDTDIYLLRPLDMEASYLFGQQEPGLINNAVLRIPAESSLLSALLEVFEKRTTPKWLPWRSYLQSRARELVGGGVDLTRLPWGVTGPMALTSAATKLGLASQAQPMDVFYPAAWSKADWILDPHATVADATSERTVAIHLWNHCIHQFKDKPAPRGSFLERLQNEGRA